MTTWIGTSWKMNKTLTEALAFAEALAAALPEVDPRVQPFVIPPFIAVREVKPVLAETGSRSARRTCTGRTLEPGPARSRRCMLDGLRPRSR